jgi:hypothetical protein
MVIAAAARDARKVGQKALPILIMHRIVEADYIPSNDRTGALRTVCVVALHHPTDSGHRAHTMR